MFVPVCDRPSLAELTGAHRCLVMESDRATMHRKCGYRCRQLPITGFAHKARVIGDLRVGAVRVLAARHMAAECCRAAVLDRRHHLELAEADMAGIGLTPCRSMAAENIRDLQRWTGQGRGPLRRRRVFLVRVGLLGRLFGWLPMRL